MQYRSTFLIILIGALILLVQGQGCSSGTRFSLNEITGFKSQQSGGGNGNGTGYDGKLRIFHHYVDGFTCENKDRPESILIRNKDLQWALIRNTKTKCSDERVFVDGVSYIEGDTKAIYQGDIYVPPRNYVVDASEPPNLDGLKLEQGICEDINGKCSLRAAFNQASVTAMTAAVTIQIPSGKYVLGGPLFLTATDRNTHPISILGESAATTVIDGNSTYTGIYMGFFNLAPILVAHLTIQNSIMGISFDQGDAPLTIDDCVFKNNFSEAVSVWGNSSGPRIKQTDFSIRNSNFFGNGTVAIHVQGGFRVLVEDSTIDSSQGKGIWMYVTPSLVIRRSTISNGAGAGITIESCVSCLIENTTVVNNLGGLDISTDAGTPAWQMTIQNSTIVGNNILGGPNIKLNIFDAQTQVVLRNSIVATNDARIENCSSTNNNFALTSVNNLFDYKSCGVLGSADRIMPIQLGPLADNKGPTLTMLPLVGSPAIDAGDNKYCGFQDQRGLVRSFDYLGLGKRCDIGAVEVQ